VAAIFADVSLGAWHGQWIASAFCRQLGLVPLPPVQPLAPVNTSGEQRHPDYADTIARLIDTESSGDCVVTAALEAAQQVLRAVRRAPPTGFVIIAPRFGRSWEREDVLFIGFLARGLQATNSQLLIAATEPVAPLPWHIVWLNAPRPVLRRCPSPNVLTLVPGVIDPELARLLNHEDLVPEEWFLRGAKGHIVVDPALRRDPVIVGTAPHDQLAERATSIDWLRAYARGHGAREKTQLGFLCEQAFRRFAEGGYGIAARLLESAHTAAVSTVSHAAVTLQMQGTRIALMQFEEAAAAPDPPSDLPPGLQGALLLCKAWGLVMTERAAEAEPYFQRALDLLHAPAPDRYYLYLLNIAALSKLRLGQFATALTLEKQIERALTAAPKTDWHIAYVNSINLARLYRRSGDYERAESYYNQAFATNLGLRSHSDLVYVNACWAQLNDQRRHPHAAFLGWLRTGMHWVSGAAPEALSPRVAQAILGRRLEPTDVLPEAVSEALTDRLRAAAVRAGFGEAGFEERRTGAVPPAFRASQAVPEDTLDYAAGQPGWSVLVSTTHTAAPPFRGPAYDRLCQVLAHVMETACPALAAVPVSTFVVDARQGTEMAVSAIELLDTAVRWGIRRLHFAGTSLELTSHDLQPLRRKLRVRLGPGVDFARQVERGVEVHFKRYRAPLQLSRTMARLLELIDSGVTIEELQGRFTAAEYDEDVLAALQYLEQARVITTELPVDLMP